MSKYLDLAIAMYRNRGDWSDGYNYVKSALRDFEVETKLDEEIVEELNKIIYEYSFVDGRAFRDCEYSYYWIYDNLLTAEERKIYDEVEF